MVAQKDAAISSEVERLLLNIGDPRGARRQLLTSVMKKGPTVWGTGVGRSISWSWVPAYTVA
ncbi:hypothetical protein PGB90_004481 [Kerria lacca]